MAILTQNYDLVSTPTPGTEFDYSGTNANIDAANQTQATEAFQKVYSGQAQSALPAASMITSGVFFILMPLILLDVIVKSMALWKAARNNQSWWFVALILTQTMGILPIIYLLVGKKDKNKMVVATPPVTTPATK